MGVYSVLVALQATDYKEYRNIMHDDFVGPLQITPEDNVKSTLSDNGMSASSVVELSITRLRDFEHEAEPTEAMFTQLRSNLESVAAFLDRRPQSVFEEFHQRNLTVNLFIDIWMDKDQFELSLPPKLMQACGRLQLGVEFISNDIPASDLID